MKKAIVFCGPKGSGKTYAAKCIAEIFNPIEVRNIIAYETQPTGHLDLSLTKLVIVDGIKEENISRWEKVRNNFENCQFIFCTQDDIDILNYNANKCSVIQMQPFRIKI